MHEEKTQVALLLRLAAVIAVVLTADVSSAQGSGRGYIEQNTPPPTELVVARWHFGTNGRIGHMGWSHNYPSSDRNFNEFIRNATGIDVELASYRIVELGDPDVFDYPFAYVSEPGEMELTDQEKLNLREFIDRGGFVLMDDFDGVAQLENMRLEVQSVFPERPFFAVTADHDVFRIHFELSDLERMSPYVPGGEIVYFGMLNQRGELAIAAGHNNDLANFWDWYDQARYPLEPAADAFRLGINFIIWSMTH